MSQTVVADEPVQAYEGKVENSIAFPTTIESKIASELIYFGKLAIVADADVVYGGADGGPQEVQLPTTAAEVLLAKQAGGVAIADPSVERLRVSGGGANSAPYGAYLTETAVPVMRKGRIWVVVEAAVTALSLGVFVRMDNAGGSPPAASLGSFSPVDSGADFEPAPEGFAWAGAASIGGVEFGLLSVNLPA